MIAICDRKQNAWNKDEHIPNVRGISLEPAKEMVLIEATPTPPLVHKAMPNVMMSKPTAWSSKRMINLRFKAKTLRFPVNGLILS